MKFWLLVDDASLRGRILGVRMPVDEDEGEPWLIAAFA